MLEQVIYQLILSERIKAAKKKFCEIFQELVDHIGKQHNTGISNKTNLFFILTPETGNLFSIANPEVRSYGGTIIALKL